MEPFELDDKFKQIFRDKIRQFGNLMSVWEELMPTLTRKQVDALLHRIHELYLPTSRSRLLK